MDIKEEKEEIIVDVRAKVRPHYTVFKRVNPTPIAKLKSTILKEATDGQHKQQLDVDDVKEKFHRKKAAEVNPSDKLKQTVFREEFDENRQLLIVYVPQEQEKGIKEEKVNPDESKVQFTIKEIDSTPQAVIKQEEELIIEDTKQDSSDDDDIPLSKIAKSKVSKGSHSKNAKPNKVKGTKPIEVKPNVRVTNFQCEVCKKYFTTNHYLKKHLKNGTCAACTKCGKSFKSIKHHICVDKESYVICDHCGKDFPKKNSLKSHIMVHAVHRVKCEICNLDFKPRSLVFHKRITHVQENVACPVCAKVFKSSFLLRAHVKIHERKKFECKICRPKRKFINQGFLNIHMRFHDNPEQFKCKICDFQTRGKYHLKGHLKTHDKNREMHLKCTRCDYKTDSNRYLKRHYVRHEKFDVLIDAFPNSIQCEKCFLIFKDEKRFKLHLETVHINPLRIECDGCNHVTPNKYLFIKHYQRYHIKK